MKSSVWSWEKSLKEARLSLQCCAYSQVMAIGSTIAGLLADSLVRSGMSVTNVRKLVQTIAFMVPAG